jgi:hypothetical protein
MANIRYEKTQGKLELHKETTGVGRHKNKQAKKEGI